MGECRRCRGLRVLGHHPPSSKVKVRLRSGLMIGLGSLSSEGGEVDLRYDVRCSCSGGSGRLLYKLS